MKYKHIYRFTPSGVTKFNDLFNGKFSNDPGRDIRDAVSFSPDFSLLEDPRYVLPVENSTSFDTAECKDTFSMIKTIVNSLGGASIALSMINDREMMMWLTYALVDLLTSRDENGFYFIGAKARYVPPYADQTQTRDVRRHLLQNRIRIHCEFGNDADFFLENYEPHTGGEIMENFQFRSESYQRNILKLIGMLYNDVNTDSFKRGSGGRKPGCVDSLYRYLSQMSIVWCVEGMSHQEIYEKLPSHFDRFKE